MMVVYFLQSITNRSMYVCTYLIIKITSILQIFICHTCEIILKQHLISNKWFKKKTPKDFHQMELILFKIK